MPSRSCSMRSARVVSLKSRLSIAMSSAARNLGMHGRRAFARRCASQATNHCAMRTKRGHQNARASGKSCSGAKCFSPSASSLASGSAGRRSRRLGEIADRAVDHGAAVARAGRRVDGIERREPEDVLGVDRVGIAQPMLDLGDAELRSARIERRPRARALGSALRFSASIEAARPERDIARRARAPRSSAARPRPPRAAA